MTRREFDALTKKNLGPCLSSSETADYLDSRFRNVRPLGDFLAYRRADVRPGLPVLAVGSPYRVPAAYRRDNGLPMLVAPGGYRAEDRPKRWGCC